MSERIVFWYGCNVVRHGDIVHAATALLEAVGIDAIAVGGPQYCCGTTRDEDLNAAESMAKRTVTRFNRIGEDRVVTWCPSCYRHMNGFMREYNDAHFDVSHISQLLHERRAELARKLVRPVAQKVLLHAHFGFREVDVNPLVRDLVALVPGIEIVPTDYAAPGHMCSALAAVPDAVRDVNRRTIEAARAGGVDCVLTVFHSCQRMLCGLEPAGRFRVRNWVTVIAESMGLSFPDEYGAWKNAPDEAGVEALVGTERIDKAGADLFRRGLLPELRAKPPR